MWRQGGKDGPRFEVLAPAGGARSNDGGRAAGGLRRLFNHFAARKAAGESRKPSSRLAQNQSRDEPAQSAPSATVRSQNPEIIVPPPDPPTPPATTPPVTPTITPVTAKDETLSPRFQGDAQVRIVATIGTTPIYEREVREAVYQRLPEIINLTAHERKLKEKAMFNEELRRLIERELILDELHAMLSQKKQCAALETAEGKCSQRRGESP